MMEIRMLEVGMLTLAQVWIHVENMRIFLHELLSFQSQVNLFSISGFTKSLFKRLSSYVDMGYSAGLF
jgi:hypothetical protein